MTGILNPFVSQPAMCLYFEALVDAEIVFKKSVFSVLPICCVLVRYGARHQHRRLRLSHWVVEDGSLSPATTSSRTSAIGTCSCKCNR